MSIPNRPGSRAENLYGNMIGQETATPPTNPQSRIEDYLDYILNNGTQLEQEIKDDVDALKGIGRYLSLWDCTTGKPTTDPKKLPYKYKSGDYYIVSAVGATNYMPSGTQYEGTASSTTDSGVSVNDFYLFDGTTWSRMAHSSVESVFVATYTKTNNAWSCDKTFAEIIEAYNAGKLCFGEAVIGDNRCIMYIREAYSLGGGITRGVAWYSIRIASSGYGWITPYLSFVHYNDDAITEGGEAVAVLPSVTSSDNGKVLGVSSGAWNKVDVHNIPAGGTNRQVLRKNGNEDYSVSWEDCADIAVVHYTYDSENDKIICDKTAVYIIMKIIQGTPIIGTFDVFGIKAQLYSCSSLPDNSIVFVGRILGMGDAIRLVVRHGNGESIDYGLYPDNPIEFNILCNSGIWIDQISGCDLHEHAPVDIWNELMNLIDTYGSSVGRSLCAKASVYYQDPVFRITGHVDNRIRYYCERIYYDDNTGVYTFRFAADDGSSLSIDADVSDPNNIVYSITPNFDGRANPAAAFSTSFPSYAFAVNTSSICGVLPPNDGGFDFLSQAVVCFPIYPATQKFLVAAMSSIGTDVTITYNSADDPDFAFDITFIKYPCLVVPTVEEQDFSQNTVCLYLTRKYYISSYCSEYMECKFPFTYNSTAFLIDLKRVLIAYEDGSNMPPTITIEGNATLA